MSVKGVETMSAGSPAFGIKPYPVLVTQVLVSSRTGCVAGFAVYCKYTKCEGKDEYEVEDAGYSFHPSGVVVNEAVLRFIEASSAVLEERFKRTAPEVVKELQRRTFVSGEASECPGFKKAWSEQAHECVECAQVFPEEHSACQAACQQTAPAVVIPPAASTFEGFRKGSKAQVLYETLRVKQSIAIAEVAQILAPACNVTTQKALEITKGYLWEWKKGTWGGKPLPFHVEVSKDAVISFKEHA